jgi:nitrite reductase/ring-hydroxylating ferredoxin subunit
MLREGLIVPGNVNGRELAFYLLDGRPYCTDDLCTHEDNLLSEGYVDGDEVECAYHGARFDIRTGAATRLPAPSSIRSYPVEVRDGQVYVAL